MKTPEVPWSIPAQFGFKSGGRPRVKDLALSSVIPDFAEKGDLSDYALKDSLSGYALKTDLEYMLEKDKGGSISGDVEI